MAVVAVQTAFPQEEECAGTENARSAEAFATAEKAHSDWAQVGHSAELRVDDSIRAGSAPHD